MVRTRLLLLGLAVLTATGLAMAIPRPATPDTVTVSFGGTKVTAQITHSGSTEDSLGSFKTHLLLLPNLSVSLQDAFDAAADVVGADGIPEIVVGNLMLAATGDTLWDATAPVLPDSIRLSRST